MHRLRYPIVILAATALCACASVPPSTPAQPAPAEYHDPTRDLGILWVKHAAEYKAIASQVYRNAQAALPGFVADTSWSAMPEQRDAEALPPAVILDVDETVVSNVDFQLTFERPFTNDKHDRWNASYRSLEVPGVKDFVDAARAQGVTVFFVTNRPCESYDGDPDPCPQKKTTVEDIREVGIDVTPAFVMLSDEQPGWDREKLVRRRFIAERYRVIMLIGDDFGDFVPCSRTKVLAPCATPATQESRRKALEKYEKYWGAGWYILPNPMHGSWTSVL